MRFYATILLHAISEKHAAGRRLCYNASMRATIRHELQQAFLPREGCSKHEYVPYLMALATDIELSRKRLLGIARCGEYKAH
mmetsp:Transcript_27778/g.51863  ORF Transcript_27778/g.51863 Transcript_27778/m.51863 type:complete len:82 (-) Transcript_27778:2-247(-)